MVVSEALTLDVSLHVIRRSERTAALNRGEDEIKLLLLFPKREGLILKNRQHCI